ncbi:MAG: hypothetical protein M1319_04090 [Chloroflexi bacterium]|nr:hypothetical protein [Chloroflexota bacterium]
MDWTQVLKAAAILSIILGVLGIAGGFFGLLILRQAVDLLVTSMRATRESVSQFAASMEQAGEAADNAANSVDEAKRSLAIAARLSEDAAATMGTIVQHTNVQILGVRPLRGVQRWLRDEQRELSLMADQLRGTSGSLADDADNMRQLGIDLRHSGDLMASLISQLDGIAGAGRGSLLSTIKMASYAAATWLFLFSLFLIMLGGALVFG